MHIHEYTHHGREPRRRTSHQCRSCQTRRAAFTRRGARSFSARRDHDLCLRCYRTYRASLARWTQLNTINGWFVDFRQRANVADRQG